MDFPGNTDRAQTPAKCQFCEESNIRWKCINCDLFLCQQCSYRIHSKSKSSQDHQIINFKDSCTEEAAEFHRKVELDNMKCEGHQGQRCISYCCDCDHVLCFQCSEDEHKTHSKENLMTNYKRKISKIKDFKKQIGENFKLYELEKKRLHNCFDSNKQNYDEIKTKILNTHREVLTALKKYTRDLIKQLDDTYNKTRVEIQEDTATLQRSITELETKYEDINNLLLTRSAANILINTKDSKLSLELEDIRCPEIIKFIPGKILQSPLNESFGYLSKRPKMEVKYTYQIDLENVKRILHFSNQTKLIASGASNKIHKVELKDGSFSILKSTDTDIYGMAFLAEDNVVVSTGEDGLNFYNDDGTLQPFKTFSPLHTIAVHVNKQKEILVGLAEPGTSIALNDDSVRRIVVVDESGNVKKKYELETNNERLFTWPGNIKTYDDKVIIVDTFNDSLDGRILVINSNGKRQWIYSGVRDEQGFRPMDASITGNRKILISDVYNDAVHVLNYKGQLLECCVLKDKRVMLPLSLDIDHEGKIWIGSSAKVYVLELK